MPPAGTSGALSQQNLKWAQGYSTGTYSESGGWWSSVPYNRTGYASVYVRFYNQPEGGSEQSSFNSGFVYSTASTQNTSFLLPVQKQEDWNYIYKSNHGLSTGQTYILDSSAEGDGTTALVNNQYTTSDVYASAANRASKVNRIDDNSFELSYPAPDLANDRWWKGIIGYKSTSTPGSASIALLPPLSPLGSTGTDGTHGRNNGDLTAFQIPMTLSLIHISEPTRPY